MEKFSIPEYFFKENVMKKYRIMVPPPKAKRMQGSGKVIIGRQDGWNGRVEKTFLVGESTHFDFEMPDNVPWVYNNSVSDGEYFDIKLVYTNKDGTREEVQRPVPEEIK